MAKALFSGFEKYTRQVSAKELSILLRVSSSLASTMDLSEVLQTAIESAAHLLGLRTGAIYTLEGETLRIGAATPPLPENLPSELHRANIQGHPHIQRAIQTKTPVYIRDTLSEALTPEEKYVVETRQLVSILFFPLILKDQSIGVFIVGTTDRIHTFTESEMDLCYILSFQASIAISNAQLYNKAQQAISDLTKAYEATLEGWSWVLDMRDQVTDAHTQRVASITVALARKMGIPEAELEHIRRGALLHDIGKMAIPDAILQKSDVLTAGEMAIMQTHPDKAFQILSKIDYLIPDIDIPYCHHEKWDGTGYPRRLKGEAIPLSARIFAVVDVYDALTTERPYRKAIPQEQALAYIREQSGTHFYPEAVKAFLEILNEDQAATLMNS